MTSRAAVSFPPLEESCPWCGQSIPHEQLDAIRERIELKERAQTRAVERRLTEELDARLAAADAEHAAALAKVKNAGDAAVTAAKKQAEAESSAAIAAAKAEFAEHEAAAVMAANAARLAAEAELAAATDANEQTIQTMLAEQREALEQHHDKEMSSEKARGFAELQKVQERLAVVQRQLERKTTEELGEGAEVDLYEELRRAFPSDQIRRVKKGEPGADIVHHIVEGGRQCGAIVYDSKNRTAWRNDYVTKLRRDQLAAEADHAVLATAVFPAGSRQLLVQGGVTVANPARVLAIVEIFRKHLIHVATLRLSDQARTEKMANLYDYITSERFTQLMTQADRLAESLLELEVKEKRAHDNTWKKRGELIRAVEQNSGSLAAEIDRIVTAPVVPLQQAT